MTMLPRLQAEEQLAQLVGRQLAAGACDPLDAGRIVEGWRAAAAGEASRRPAGATPAALAAMGIAVVTVPSEPPQKAVNDG